MSTQDQRGEGGDPLERVAAEDQPIVTDRQDSLGAGDEEPSEGRDTSEDVVSGGPTHTDRDIDRDAGVDAITESSAGRAERSTGGGPLGGH